jgi:hypothetical protein
MVAILFLVFIVWLIIGIVRKEFSSSGFWYSLFIALAILIFLGLSFPKTLTLS